MSQHSGQWNSQTGQLDRRTLLHKRYVIQRTIGHGGMGAVYQAKDLKRQGAICAIKEMSLSMVPPDEQAQAIQNFKIEAKILWGLNHANLPAFTGFFSENQRYFMVMEYIDGNTLEELLERNGKPFAERRVLGWARQLCDVLEYLHSQNPPIIFRDMKPGNIMLTRSGHIKLIDFGIARFFRSTSSQDTQLLGTPGFAPPEQYGKSQTDVRSDIYSLAITLYQLLTDTLSETGFGLKDVRATHPYISPVVARALEKASSLEPADRFDTVAAFRRALLGEGTFLFDNGEMATNPRELADLCARHPEEASDYLASGEIEVWLHEIGEQSLSQTARHLRMTEDNPQDLVEMFLQSIGGPHLRPRQRSAARPSSNRSTATSAVAKPKSSSGSSRSSKSTRKPPPLPVQVNPRVLDFGSIHPSISAPQIITITGDQGLLVSGTIHAMESWLLVDTSLFEGTITSVNVRVNSLQLHGSTHYTGSIVITPDNDDLNREIIVTVEADVVGPTRASSKQKHRGKTVGADLDDEEEDMALTMGSQTMLSPPSKAHMIHSRNNAPPSGPTRDSEYKAKYGQPNLNGTASSSWDPERTTAPQRLWIQRGLTFIAAFMVASLCYTLLAALIQASPLPPNPWFAVVLATIIPATTLGALLRNWHRSWTKQDTINHACTGTASTLVALALIKTIWQLLARIDLPPQQFTLMLFVGSIAATVGINDMISTYILEGTAWALTRIRLLRTRRVAIAAAATIGGGLGYLLTIGLAFSGFTVFAILLGIAVASALVLHVDQQIKLNNP